MTPQEQLRKFRESQLSPQELLQKFRAQSKNNPFGEKAKTFEELEAASVGQDRENFDYKTGARDLQEITKGAQNVMVLPFLILYPLQPQC